MESVFTQKMPRQIDHPEDFSDFVIQTVVPLLEDGLCRMSGEEIAKNLCIWIEGFEGQVKLWTDAAAFDWPHIENMFNNYGWPRNLIKKPIALSFPNSIHKQDFLPALKMHLIHFNPDCEGIMH